MASLQRFFIVRIAMTPFLLAYIAFFRHWKDILTYKKFMKAISQARNVEGVTEMKISWIKSKG